MKSLEIKISPKWMTIAAILSCNNRIDQNKQMLNIEGFFS